MECVTCGGTEFYKDLGYFYCLECQTQSQDVREHVFQEEVTNISTARKIKDPAKRKAESKVTSWECYNIILHSLTNQMIELGADRNLKSVVKILWIAYLEKLQVFDLEVDTKPRLPAVNVKRDVAILYGREKKRRTRKKSTSDESSSNFDTASSHVSSKRERTKRKSALALAEYTDLSFKSTQESSILGTETLTSMKSSSITEEKTLKFNHSAKKELRRKLSSSHLKEHEKDINLTLNCHKLIYKERSRKYKRGAQVLSPDKPYCILYLGLLIIKDQVQLCDMLRFIKEGHLSYNNYNHLLQDEMSDKILGVQSHPKNMLLTHKGIRTATYKLAKFLGILHYVEVPDVVKLCDRFCREMNLPDQILEAVRTIISVTNPTFAIQKRDECLPNYEGRCMSIILFVIKLLFGMDGVTEYELSKFAKLLNEGGYKNKFFNIQEWLTHIQFRRLVIEQNHFPINYETDNSKISSDLYLQHIKSHNVIFDESAKLSNVMKNYKQLLERLREIQHDFITHLKFPPSLTPFHDYTRNITDIFGGKYHSNIKRDFKNDDLGFLKCSERFFEQLDEQIRVENGGGNYNIILEETKCRIITQPKSFYLVELIDDLRKEHKRIFKQRRNQHLLKEKKIKHKFEQGTSLNGDESYKIHYLPQKRYWLNTTVGRYDTACDYLKPFLKTYPSTFMQIFEECCRIIEQSQADLFQSFQSTELFLVYLVDFSGDNREHLVNKRLVHHINLALDCW